MTTKPQTRASVSSASPGGAPPPPAPAGPRAAPLAVNGPQGRKLVGNIGPGLLYPGAGKIVQRTQKPLACGSMTGHAFDAIDHPNSRDATRTSTRFVGEIIAVDHLGTILRGAEWYLPPVPARGIKAALKLNAASGQPVGFAFEVWCEPDQEGRPASPLGYSYVTYDRMARRDDPLLALAYEAGILERPAPALTGPEDLPDDVDPETGEIRPGQQAAA